MGGLPGPNPGPGPGPLVLRRCHPKNKTRTHHWNFPGSSAAAAAALLLQWISLGKWQRLRQQQQKQQQNFPKHFPRSPLGWVQFRFQFQFQFWLHSVPVGSSSRSLRSSFHGNKINNKIIQIKINTTDLEIKILFMFFLLWLKKINKYFSNSKVKRQEANLFLRKTWIRYRNQPFAIAAPIAPPPPARLPPVNPFGTWKPKPVSQKPPSLPLTFFFFAAPDSLGGHANYCCACECVPGWVFDISSVFLGKPTLPEAKNRKNKTNPKQKANPDLIRIQWVSQ